MAEIIYSARARSDLGRIIDFIFGIEPELSLVVVTVIAEAISVLRRHPLIGRVAEQGLRELVISHGRTGYVALYRFLPSDDAVLVLGLRRQREVAPQDDVQATMEARSRQPGARRAKVTRKAKRR